MAGVFAKEVRSGTLLAGVLCLACLSDPAVSFIALSPSRTRHDGLSCFDPFQHPVKSARPRWRQSCTRLSRMAQKPSELEDATAAPPKRSPDDTQSLAEKINKYDMEKVAEKIDAGEFDAPTFPRPNFGSAQGLVSRIGPVLILNFVTVLWGSQHAIIKLAVGADDGGASPAELNLLRFTIASLIFLPFAPPLPSFFTPSTPPQPSNNTKPQEAARELVGSEVWAAGGLLGVLTFAGYAMQSVGLQYTSASRSAFILYLNVKLVPILARLVYGRRISSRTWISAAVAVVGTTLLGFDGSQPNIGDAWSLGAAGASAAFILTLESAAREFESGELNSVAQLTVAALCLIWVAVVDHPASITDLIPSSQREVVTAAYLGVVTTALTSFLQTIGQQSVKAEKAALVYAMDPVYAAGFSYVLLGEQLGPPGVVGALLLVLAAVFSRPSGSPKQT